MLGVALLVGSVAPLDLRLMGVWPDEPYARLARVLRPVAAAGAALAVATGLLLFIVAAADYAGAPLFQAKMALVAFGGVNAALHSAPRLDALPVARQRLAGAASLAAWVAALVCGRLIGYA